MKPNRVRGAALALLLGASASWGLPGAAAGAAAGSLPADGGAALYRLALTPGGRGTAGLDRQRTRPFALLGVSWTDPSAELAGTVEARTRDAATGRWSPWTALEPVAPGLDGPRPGARGSTEPVWVGPSDGAEVRIRGRGALPAGLEAALVDPGPDPASPAQRSGPASARRQPPAPRPAPPGPASTAPRPAVVPRIAWGADETLDTEGPVYLPGGRIKAVFVHHTADARPYDCAQSAAIVRAIHVFHVKANGWRDIGYNFLVDRCGTVFEGRQGGIDRPVRGAHTGGWNAESSGIAVLGEHTAEGAPPAALAAVARVAAYKLGQYGGVLDGTTTLTAGATQRNFSGASFTAGRAYPFRAVSGHRDGFATECPGDALYAQLERIRTADAVSGW
ncbi:N-acetylmuramoyl-L-alanine amidase [Streptomyces sp. NPDC046866]|uniref:N-acetylmuramoyl-L-alanine amidase n=1 Tax=Streptomyces sp. NPDC046866 TaxID=3154921 RepID=UPI003451F108